MFDWSVSLFIHPSVGPAFFVPYLLLFCVFDAYLVINYVYYCQVIGEYEACEIPHFFFHFINI